MPERPCPPAVTLAPSPNIAPSPSAAPSAPPAPDLRYVLDGTEVHELVSKTNGRAYRIMVGTPYEPGPGRRFATIRSTASSPA